MATPTPEWQRRAEQLVLYMRALQLLNSALTLAKHEKSTSRLQPSNAVKNGKQPCCVQQNLTSLPYVFIKYVGILLGTDTLLKTMNIDEQSKI